MTTNLLKRGNIFYARVAVPKTLRELRAGAGHVSNPKEVVRSLSTGELRQAQLRLPAVLANILKGFVHAEAELRASGARKPIAPTAEDLAELRKWFLHRVLKDDSIERIARPSARQVEAKRAALAQAWEKSPSRSDWDRLVTPGYLECAVASTAREQSIERRRVLADELRAHLADANYVLVEGIIDGMREAKNLALPSDSFEYKALARGLMEQWLRGLEIAERRDEGIPDEAEEKLAESLNAASSSLSPVVELSTERSKRGQKVGNIRLQFDGYLREQKSQITPNTRQDLLATVRQFVECNGNLPVADYRKEHMAAYKRGLQRFPANAAKLYPGLTFPQILERNKTDRHPTLKSNSVRSKLSALSAFGKWLAENVDGVEASNFATTLPKRTDRERMEPFTQDEVKRILNSYAFVGCESPRNYQKPGSYQLRGWHYWLILIAAFTGARLNEIVQLKLTDLHEIDGIWVFHITDEGESQSLKTKSSRRDLPVHPRLLELGLLDYRDRLAADGAESLFEDVSVGKDGRRSEAAGKWVRKFLAAIGVKGEGDRGGAHRWRHTITDALRRASVDNYDIAAALGHTIDIARMTRQYGREMDMALAKRREIIAMAEYPGVDFDALK